ncbi:MAG: cytochrome [Proteobacteria bacterium]|nr:cytochrome [Pseudomonadota bacterium]
MKTRLLVVSLLALPVLASCAESGPPPRAEESGHGGQVWNEMEGEKLQALGAAGDAARGAITFEVCEGCHRNGGAGRVNGSYPRLAGQHAPVLIKQITDIRAGRRTNHKMVPFSGADVIGAQDIADIAAYLAAQPVTPDNGRGPGDDIERGGQLYARDCATCHGEFGKGAAARFYPRLSGQHYLYLLREARAIRNGERGNSNPEMVQAIKAYSDADLEAVSDFVSRLPPG